MHSCKKTCSVGFTMLYEGEAQVRIMPDKDTIKINDSIHVEMSLPYNMLDLLTNEYVNVKGLDFGQVLTKNIFLSSVTGSVKSHGFEVWQLVSKEGVSKEKPGSGVVSIFTQKDFYHSIKFTLIPKETGVATFYVYPQMATKDDNCIRIYVKPTIINPNKRHYLFYDFGNIYSPGTSWFLRSEAFVIYVKP